MSNSVALALAVLVIPATIGAWFGSPGLAFKKMQDKIKSFNFRVPFPDCVSPKFV
jgi:hypothetical protein